jgi:hypothetical protein
MKPGTEGGVSCAITKESLRFSSIYNSQISSTKFQTNSNIPNSKFQTPDPPALVPDITATAYKSFHSDYGTTVEKVLVIGN